MRYIWIIYILFAIYNHIVFSSIITYGTARTESINRIIKTQDGNFLFVGFSYSSNSAGYSDILIIKVNPDGQVIWKKMIGGSYDDHGLDVIEINNNYYIVAKTRSFEPGNNDDKRFETLLIQLDQNGNLLNATFIQPSEQYDYIMNKIVTGVQQGNIVLIGSTQVFNNLNKNDISLITVDNAGNVTVEAIKPCKTNPCNNNASDESNETVYHALNTSDGGFIIGGNTDYNASNLFIKNPFLIKFKPVTQNNVTSRELDWSNYYIFKKLDQSGNAVSDLEAEVRYILELSAGGYLAVGTIKFSDTLNRDVFILKLDNTGTITASAILCLGTNGKCSTSLDENPIYVVEANSGFYIVLRADGKSTIIYIDQNLNPQLQTLKPKSYNIGELINSAFYDSTTQRFYLSGYTSLYGMGLGDGVLSIINSNNGEFISNLCSAASNDLNIEIIKIDVKYSQTQTGTFEVEVNSQELPIFIATIYNSFYGVKNVTQNITVSDAQDVKTINACAPHIVVLTDTLLIDPAYINLDTVRYLSVLNKGLSDLEIKKVYISGANAKYFSAVSNCNAPVIYNGMCFIEVKVKVPDKKKRTAILNIDSNDPAFSTIRIKLVAVPEEPPKQAEGKPKKEEVKKPVFTNVSSCNVGHIPIYLILLLPMIPIIKRIIK